MAAYIIAEIEVTDPAAYEEYRARVPAVIAAHGGRYLARGGLTETIEGGAASGRIVLLEFPDMTAARGFVTSADYAPLGEIRKKASRSRLIMVDGYRP